MNRTQLFWANDVIYLLNIQLNNDNQMENHQQIANNNLK